MLEKCIWNLGLEPSKLAGVQNEGERRMRKEETGVQVVEIK